MPNPNRHAREVSEVMMMLEDLQACKTELEAYRRRLSTELLKLNASAQYEALHWVRVSKQNDQVVREESHARWVVCKCELCKASYVPYDDTLAELRIIEPVWVHDELRWRQVEALSTQVINIAFKPNPMVDIILGVWVILLVSFIIFFAT